MPNSERLANIKICAYYLLLFTEPARKDKTMCYHNTPDNKMALSATAASPRS